MNTDLILTMLFNLVGGLGIFLLGMKYMQQGLQVVAGPNIRRLINKATSNRFMAVGIGTLVTMLVQSSSVTSVMVIGLVNSELMSLSGAIAVMMGANIGTTITGWILVLKIGKYGLPILGISTFFWLFVKNEKIRYTALAILGIGMIFFGLELMKDGFKPLRDMPEFESWFLVFKATNYFGVLKSALVGCILTMIVQSSSATLGITIALATAGVIDFPTAGALVLGENIGTTITAYLASIGADDPNAKRSAYFHIMFNVTGVLVITALFFPIYLPLVISFVEVWTGHPPDYQVAGEFVNITFAIASVHSGFNIANTLLFIGFVPRIANFLLTRTLQSDSPKSEYLTHLEFQPDMSPISAIERSGHEIDRMRTHTSEMLDKLFSVTPFSEKKLRSADKETRATIDQLFEREKILDTVQIEITTFLSDLLASTLSKEITDEARQQLRIADEYESVSDYIVVVLKLHLRLEEGQSFLTEAQRRELEDLHEDIVKFFELIHGEIEDDKARDFLAKIRKRSRKITSKIRDLRGMHWDRLSNEDIPPLISTSYMDIANGYRRIKDHLLNIAEARVGGKQRKKKK